MKLRLACVVVGVVAAFGAVVVVVGCDPRPSLAQLRFFEGTRHDLVEQCCTCLSRRGTGAEGASCEEGVFVDGGVVAPDGAVTGDGDRSGDDNDVVDKGEVPCLCGGLDEDACFVNLVNNSGIVVPGACIDEIDRTAPCETACAGVLSFEPVAGD